MNEFEDAWKAMGITEAQIKLTGFMWLVTIVLIILKCQGIIAWSWWWVTILAWLGPALWIVFGVIALIFGIIASIFMFLGSLFK